MNLFRKALPLVNYIKQMFPPSIRTFLSVNDVTVCLMATPPRAITVSVRGTQREYSSKPLKHSIVKRILVFKQWICAYFYPLKIFHLFGFPS